MRHPRPRLLSAAVAAVLLAGLSACAADGTDDGPLGSTPPAGRFCTVAGLTRTATVGVLALRNRSSHDVVVQRLSLRRPDGLRVSQARLVPVLDDTLIGSDNRYPPQWAKAHPGTWAAGQDAAVGTVPPGEELGLVLEVEITGHAVGASSSLDVDYRAGAKHYRWNSGLALQVAPPGARCPT